MTPALTIPLRRISGARLRGMSHASGRPCDSKQHHRCMSRSCLREQFVRPYGLRSRDGGGAPATCMCTPHLGLIKPCCCIGRFPRTGWPLVQLRARLHAMWCDGSLPMSAWVCVHRSFRDGGRSGCSALVQETVVSRTHGWLIVPRIAVESPYWLKESHAWPLAQCKAKHTHARLR